MFNGIITYYVVVSVGWLICALKWTHFLYFCQVSFLSRVLSLLCFINRLCMYGHEETIHVIASFPSGQR